MIVLMLAHGADPSLAIELRAHGFECVPCVAREEREIPAQVTIPIVIQSWPDFELPAIPTSPPKPWGKKGRRMRGYQR